MKYHDLFYAQDPPPDKKDTRFSKYCSDFIDLVDFLRSKTETIRETEENPGEIQAALERDDSVKNMYKFILFFATGLPEKERKDILDQSEKIFGHLSWFTVKERESNFDFADHNRTVDALAEKLDILKEALESL
ncbi:MAG: hypothetical protein OEX08_00905 [Candidatus Nomurabacteria bacterium]|nr:hypothetical protein [Candidatus Nomurabacteria bacterium]